jgi:hypothetical protein
MKVVSRELLIFQHELFTYSGLVFTASSVKQSLLLDNSSEALPSYSW